MIRCTIKYTVFEFYFSIKIVQIKKCFELQKNIIIIHNDAVLFNNLTTLQIVLSQVCLVKNSFTHFTHVTWTKKKNVLSSTGIFTI